MCERVDPIAGGEGAAAAAAGEPVVERCGGAACGHYYHRACAAGATRFGVTEAGEILCALHTCAACDGAAGANMVPSIR